MKGVPGARVDRGEPDMEWKTAKRFYEKADVAEVDGGFTIALDGRPVHTPRGAPLAVANRDLARAMAEEWAAQKDDIQPHTMPLTRLANSALDGVAARRDDVIEHVVDYAATDLLCYRADGQPELAARQQERWQPLLDWVAGDHGAALAVTDGVVPVAQPEAALEALREAVATFGDLELAAVSSATAASGSLVVALALAAGRIDAEEACEVSQLDEAHQAGKWGEDPEAAERRRNLRDEIEAAAAVLRLCRA